MPTSITVDVVSDVICPWCWIGKRRLEKAIAASGGLYDVQVRWEPFQLNPQMPKEGISRREYRASKFGSWERSLSLDAKVAAAGRGEGLEFAFDRVERTPNTFDAHRLIALAGSLGIQDAVVEALFLTYFAKGLDIGDSRTLLDVVGEAGMDRDQTRAFLESGLGVGTIQTHEEQARSDGVQGVPFFLINQKLSIAGAADPEAFLAAFAQASA